MLVPVRSRRSLSTVVASVALAAAGAGALTLGGVAPAAAASCTTPSPRAVGAGAAKAAVKRLARGVGTNTAKRPRIASPTGRPPTHLVTQDVVRCSGRRVQVGDTVTVRYSLVNWGGRSRTVDSTWTAGKTTAAFALQRGALIDGWVEGIPGMAVGTRRLLVVPPKKGYGARGTNGVPANSTLIFAIDVVGIS